MNREHGHHEGTGRQAEVREHDRVQPWELHDDDHEDGHAEATDDAVERSIDDAIWAIDNVELTTVGIDIGSATSHLMFSRVHLQRRGIALSSRFVVVDRQALYRSDILLTPYRADGLIDAEALRAFIDRAYAAAEIARDAVDAGAVILTGVAVERANARAIAELFAEDGGRFVCATAGHNLEALLAAHGSGAVARSRELGEVLGVDIGGGTTKLTWCRDGEAIATMAIEGGARLVTVDASGLIDRIEQSIRPVAEDLHLRLELGARLAEEDRIRLASALARRIRRAATGDPEPGATLAGAPPGGSEPAAIVLSGGVAELLIDDGSGRPVLRAERQSFGDLGWELAEAVARALDGLAPIILAPERIRATAIGASQFSVQVSGNTIHISGDVSLPEHNIPVVALELPPGELPDAEAIRRSIERRTSQLDLADRQEAVAIALAWDGEPRYQSLRALADGIAAAHRAAPRRDEAVFVAATGDIGASLGGILNEELGMTSGVVSIDGLELSDLDFIDVGEQVLPARVVPVVVKSLIFPRDETERPRVIGSMS